MPHKRLFWGLFLAVLVLGGTGVWLYLTPDVPAAQEATDTAVSTPTPTPRTPTILFPAEAKPYLQAVIITEHASANEALFVRTDDEDAPWQQLVPQVQPASETRFVNPLNYLLDQPSRRALPIVDETELAAYGLSAPTYTLTFYFAPSPALDDPQAEEVTLDVGGETPTGDGFYIKMSTDDRVHVVFQTGLLDLLEIVSPSG